MFAKPIKGFYTCYRNMLIATRKVPDPTGLLNRRLVGFQEEQRKLDKFLNLSMTVRRKEKFKTNF